MRRMGPGPRRGPGPGMGARRVRRRRRRVRRRRVMLVGGLVAFGAYKMSKKDADRVEQYTGIPPEELEDADLQQAMTDLNIPQQTVTAQDQEVGGAPAGATGAAGAGDAPGGGAGGDVLAQIEQLAKLKDAGVLTEEEFTAKKRQLLGM